MSRIRNGIVLFLLFSAVVSLTFVFESNNSRPVYWPGWFILKLSPETTGSAGIEALSEAGIQGAVGASNTFVSYMEIPKIGFTAISSLDEVLSRGDPRRDPYLSSVSSLFKSGNSDLIYLPADRSLQSYLRVLSSTPELRDGRIMDGQNKSFPFYSLIFLGISLVLIRVSRSNLSWVGWLVAALPCAVLMMYLDPLKLFPLLLAFFLSPALTWRNRARQGKIRTAAQYLGFSFAAFALYRGLDFPRMLELTSVLAVAGAVQLIMFRGEGNMIGVGFQEKKIQKNFKVKEYKPYKSLRGRDHSLFEPISLKKTQAAARKKTVHLFEIAASLLLVLSFAVPMRQEPAHSPLPSAKNSNIGFTDISSLFSLENSRDGRSLPDLSQLLASAAYQEGFMYGAEYRLPLPDEELKISTYTGNGSGILYSDSPITVYNTDWFEKTVQRELSRGPGLLFASLGGPAPVISVTSRFLVSDYRFSPFHMLFSGIAYLISLYFIFSPVMQERVGRSLYFPLFTSRRRAQAA